MLATRVEEVRKPCVELSLDAIGREFGEHGGTSDCIECLRNVKRDGPDLMFKIEGLHQLLGESKQHVRAG